MTAGRNVRRDRAAAIGAGQGLASLLFAVAGVIEAAQGQAAFTAMFIAIAAACLGASTATGKRGKRDDDR